MAGAAVVSGVLGGAAAHAQDRVEISRSIDTVVYGSCVPSFEAVNNLAGTIDYLEVQASIRLRSGEVRPMAFRSAYRGGIERPILPGHAARLTVQLDLSSPLGVACGDIVAMEVTDVICEAAGKPCAGVMAIDPARR
jgi:hypothetical protein